MPKETATERDNRRRAENAAARRAARQSSDPTVRAAQLNRDAAQAAAAFGNMH